MEKVYLEHRGRTDTTEHSKFYELTDDDHQVLFRWGRTGTDGKTTVALVSEVKEERTAAFQRQLKAKMAKGYVIIKNGETAVESRPSSEGRRWGLEVETHSNLDINSIVERMRERSLSVTVDTGRYFKSDGNHWDVKRDGSCGFEFASPILSGESGIFDAKIAVEKIREICPNATNSKCGIHVTIDVSDHNTKDLRRLCVGYLRAQEHFYRMCNESRQNNQYCKRNSSHRIEELLTATSTEQVLRCMDGSNRYQGLNMTRFQSLNVIEFRMLESTVAIRQVGEWIRTCVGFVDGLKASGVTFKSTTVFSDETFQKIVAGKFTI